MQEEQALGTFTFIVALAFLVGIVCYSWGEKEAYYAQGQAAYKQNLTLEDYPYDKTDGAEFSWIKGWYAADGLKTSEN